MKKASRQAKPEGRKLSARQLMNRFPDFAENSNCLINIACAQCGYREDFRIEMKSIFKLCDNGTDGYEDTDWGPNSYCQCGRCQHEGKVRDFTFDGLDEMLETQ